MSVKRYSVWEDEMFDEKHALNPKNSMVHLMVMHEDHAALEARCAALAAENAGLKVDGWITWRGGDQPVPDETTVTVIFADKDTDTDSASAFPGWFYFGDRGDIIAYKIHDESDKFAAQLRKGVQS